MKRNSSYRLMRACVYVCVMVILVENVLGSLYLC